MCNSTMALVEWYMHCPISHAHTHTLQLMDKILVRQGNCTVSIILLLLLLGTQHVGQQITVTVLNPILAPLTQHLQHHITQGL